MGMLVDSDREYGDRDYWRAVLSAGGFTAIPRWTLDPAPAAAEHREPIPDDLGAALHRLAEAAAQPLSSVLLAAHATVLAAVSGEVAVATGYLAASGARPLPCRLSTEPATWRELLEHAGQVEARLLAHRDFPVEELAGELGRTGPLFETVLDPAGDGGELAEHTVLRVSLQRDRERLELRLRYRTDVLDAAAATRIAGYHRRAFALLAADPDAEHGRQSLLSAAELAFQIDGLAGPQRELPDRRFHELFEQRVRRHPDDDRRRARRPAVELPGAQRPGQPAGPGPADPRAAPRRGRGGGGRAQPGLDGRGHRDLQGRRRLPADRAALPGRPHRPHAHPRRLPAGADRGRQHHHPGPGAARPARGAGAGVRRHLPGGARRRRPGRPGRRRSARLHLLHLRLHR